MAELNAQKVYVIGPVNGPYKIGISADPRGRLSSLQIGNHAQLKIHFQLDADNAADLEARFHASFAVGRIQGEWFDLPLPVIEEALRKGFPAADETAVADGMTPDAFHTWLAAMKAAGLARSDAHCARLLGISANSVLKLKRNGGDMRTALACAALLVGLPPYGEEPDSRRASVPGGSNPPHG